MPPYTQSQRARGQRKNRESLATSTARGFGGRSSQDALKSVQSGNGLGVPPTAGGGGGSPPSATVTPDQAGTMNAAAPGTFNGNPANGIPSSEVGFSQTAAKPPGGGETGTWQSGGGGSPPAATGLDPIGAMPYDPNRYQHEQGTYGGVAPLTAEEQARWDAYLAESGTTSRDYAQAASAGGTGTPQGGSNASTMDDYYKSLGYNTQESVTAGGGAPPVAQPGTSPGEVTHDPNAFAYTSGVYSPQGSGAAGTPNEVTRDLPQQPGTAGGTVNPQTGMWEFPDTFVPPSWQAAGGSGYEGAGGTGGFAGEAGFMSPEDLTAARNAPASFTDFQPAPSQDPITLGTGHPNATPDQLSLIQGAQAQIDAGGTDGGFLQAGARAPNAFTGPGAPGAGAQGIRDDLAAVQAPASTQGMTQIGDMGNGFTLHKDAQGNEWIQNPDGSIEQNGMRNSFSGDSGAPQAPGSIFVGADGTQYDNYADFQAAQNPGPQAPGGSQTQIPDILSQFNTGGAVGNIDESALMRSLGYGSPGWDFPDIESYDTLNINAPYTTNLDQFLDPNSPQYVSDPNLQRALGKFDRAKQIVANQDTGQYSQAQIVEARNEYNTLMAALGMYGINWNPLQGLSGPGGGTGTPIDDGGVVVPPTGGRRGGGGSQLEGNGRGRFAGHTPAGQSPFPDPASPGEPGAIDWTRDDFNRSNTDVMGDMPLSRKVDNQVQIMFGARWANASAEERTAMYEMAKSQVMADEQMGNKQKGINILQGGFDQTTRENNPFRRMSEDAALKALQNPNPVDLQGIQNRTAADYDSALNQGIQAQSGSGARRGLSAGSQAGMAGAMTAANRRDLARTLGEQTTAYQMADRQALYDAINNAAGVNQNFLGGELQQRGLLANAVRGAYDPAQNPYEGATGTKIDLSTLELAKKNAKNAGDSSWLDYANILGAGLGGLL